MSSYNTKNYTEQGGEKTVIGGILEFKPGAKMAGGLVENQAYTSDSNVKKADFNALLLKLKKAGLMAGDIFNASVLACPTPAAMPTAETTSNSGHASFALANGKITITLDCKVSELADANHGETWGTHKWLGFGVRTGEGAITDIIFTDDTGASCTLGEGDAAEALTLGLSAGDFVLYIKAEDPKYLAGEKFITLDKAGFDTGKYYIQIVESAS